MCVYVYKFSTIQNDFREIKKPSWNYGCFLFNLQPYSRPLKFIHNNAQYAFTWYFNNLI